MQSRQKAQVSHIQHTDFLLQYSIKFLIKKIISRSKKAQPQSNCLQDGKEKTKLDNIHPCIQNFQWTKGLHRSFMPAIDDNERQGYIRQKVDYIMLCQIMQEKNIRPFLFFSVFWETQEWEMKVEIWQRRCREFNGDNSDQITEMMYRWCMVWQLDSWKSFLGTCSILLGIMHWWQTISGSHQWVVEFVWEEDNLG